jgi:predicted transcriptional regulator
VNEDTNTVELATELTIAWLSNPNTRTSADDVPAFLRQMHDAVQRLATPAAEPVEAAKEYTPATTVRKSLASPDHIISMIDGKPYRTLKRHLTTNGLTPAEYRERYGLKADYPTVAPSYATARSEMAKRIGLGRKAGETVKKAGDGEEASTKAPVKRARKTGADAKKAAQDHLG